MYACVHTFDLLCFPGAVGFHDVCVQTWRPAGRRILDKMRRFFVGGAPQIDDVSYVATPKNFQVGT